ncbi:MAG: PAS domain S-box protein, partial [Flavobacteriales bacterium]|nr:PAS domain S-box protein [Flavobacteriales bacterium]
FTVYTVEDGLVDNAVNEILEDDQHNLWICTGNGVSKLSVETNALQAAEFVNYGVADGLADGRVWTVIQDQKGRIVFGTNEGLSILLSLSEQRPGELFRNSKLGLSHTIVRTILQDKDGVFWYGTENGLTMHNPSAASGEVYSYFSVKDGLADDFIWSSLEDSEGTLWFGTGQGISCLKNGDRLKGDYKFKSMSKVDGMKLHTILDIEEDSKGSIWFAGWAGVGAIEYVPKFNAYRRMSSANGLVDDNLVAIIEDNEGNLWIGTYGHGISKLMGRRFESYTRDQGLHDNFVWAVAEDLNQNIWVGGNLGGVSRMVRRRNEESITGYDVVVQKYLPENGFPGKVVNSIAVDKVGNVWFSTEGGLVKLSRSAPSFAPDGKSAPKLSFKHYTKANGLLSERARRLYQDSRGNYWIAYTGGQVHKMTIEGERAVFHKNVYKSELLNNFNTFTIHEDRRGDMWFGTGAGIVKLSINDSTGLVERERNITVKEGLVNNDVRAIVEDSEGNLWFGTGGGVSKYNPYQPTKNFENYTSKDGLVSDRIYLLQFDNDNNLWIGTNSGLDVLDLGNYMATTEKFDPLEYKYKTSGEIKIRHFGYAEGFMGNELNTGASFMDEDHNLWFGTINGVVKYNPKEDVVNNRPPLIQIAGVDLFSGLVDLSIAQEFQHDQNHFTFKFLGISHTNQEGVTYKHKLEGYSYTWSDPSSNTSITYANLPVGAFKFSVLSANADGVWNKTPATYSFSIVPPFWQSIWFYLLVVVGFAVLVYGILKIRLKALEQTARALSEQVEIKTRKLKASETQYRSLFENSGDSIFVYDKETHQFLDCNKMAVRVYGYSKEEIKSMKPYDFHKDQDPEEVRKIIESKQDSPSIYEHYTKDGRKIYVEVQSSVILFDQKEAVLSIVRDVTARREDAKKIESINKQLTGSIRYSKRILDAILRTKSDIVKVHPHSFILFKPRDIVSGDFYWFHKVGLKSIVAAVDCTGHGVAGAFMSLIGNEILDDVVKTREITDPSKILSEMHKAVVASVKKGEKLGDAVGGMDVALCCIDYETDTLEFAGAGRPLVLLRDGVEMLYPGNKYPVGLVLNSDGKYSNVYMNEQKRSNGVIKSEKIDLKKGDHIYMFTDGYCDQFGGDSGEKFMRERFSEVLSSIQ